MKRIFSTEALWPSSDGHNNQNRSVLTLILTLVVPALLVALIVLVVIQSQGHIETGVADLALLLPLGYAFAAGMVASVNPCGILMLSSYAFYQVRVVGPDYSPTRRALRAAAVSVLVTIGFVFVFGLTGAVIAAGGQWLVSAFPYAGLAIGAGMAALGVYLLASHQTLGIASGKKLRVEPGRGITNSFLFGLAYAVASLSCTLPIFLVVISGSLAVDGFRASFGPFVSYALGMGTIILAVTVGAALFQRALARWIRSLTPHIHRVSAMFLIGAGIYLVYYWLVQAGLR